MRRTSLMSSCWSFTARQTARAASEGVPREKSEPNGVRSFQAPNDFNAERPRGSAPQGVPADGAFSCQQIVNPIAQAKTSGKTAFAIWLAFTKPMSRRCQLQRSMRRECRWLGKILDGLK